jgi:hypothetical protein
VLFHNSRTAGLALSYFMLHIWHKFVEPSKISLSGSDHLHKIQKTNCRKKTEGKQASYEDSCLPGYVAGSTGKKFLTFSEESVSSSPRRLVRMLMENATRNSNLARKSIFVPVYSSAPQILQCL